jgi:hypothetical protein
MNIIGLGKAGCAIADCFSQYPQYNTYKVDVGLSGGNCFAVKPQSGPEEYEANYASMKAFLKGAKGETMLVLGGSGDISAICLRIMEQIKTTCDISVLYIRPDTQLLSEVKKMHEKVTFNVLQEYARSGQIRGICLVSNPEIENILDNVPIMGYYNKLNELIVSTIHMTNVYKNSDPVMGSLSDPGETKRIYTVGIFDIENNEEKLFFPLDIVRERGYIYSISKDRLQSESGLHKQITSQMKEKLSDENVSISFGVFPTDYNSDYGYVLAHSPNIQS